MHEFNLLKEKQINIKLQNKNKKKRKVYFPYLDALGGEVNGRLNSVGDLLSPFFFEKVA